MKLEHFFESSVDMLCIANYEGYFVDVNPAFLNLLGYTKEELLSRKINEFVLEEDRNATQKVRESIHGNERLINFQNRYVHKSGNVVWLSWSAVPVNEEQLVYAIAKDVTNEQQLRSERIKEMAKLNRLNEDLVRLNYTTSHDLRSPVNNLLSLFEILDYNKITDEDTIQLLRYMEISAKGIKESLENYLDLMQKAGKNNDNLTETCFEETLSKTTSTLSSLLTSSKTEIESDFSSCNSVLFNKDYLQSIFLNLITNSIKYTCPGIPPVIEISTRIKYGHKELIYKDYGQGFDMEKNGDNVFGLNQRFNKTQEGKGVGLYLIRNQITSLGGTITVDSKLNKGATFCITFPA